MGLIQQDASRYRGVVFKHAPPTADFACSKRIVLPGQHTKQGAWRIVRGALASDADLIGGEVEPMPADPLRK